VTSAAPVPGGAGSVVDLGHDVYQIDTFMAGYNGITAGYLIRSDRPCLVETGTAPTRRPPSAQRPPDPGRTPSARTTRPGRTPSAASAPSPPKRTGERGEIGQARNGLRRRQNIRGRPTAR
jgi:hypothetical protein